MKTFKELEELFDERCQDVAEDIIYRTFKDGKEYSGKFRFEEKGFVLKIKEKLDNYSEINTKVIWGDAIELITKLNNTNNN